MCFAQIKTQGFHICIWHLYLAGLCPLMPQSTTLFDRKQAVLPAFLSRILFPLNIRSGFVQSFHRSSCNLKWRLKSNPTHGIAVSCFLKHTVPAVSQQGSRSSLEDKCEIILNSASEHLVRAWTLKHIELYLQQFFIPV